MELVIDAQVVKAYFEETVLEIPHSLTESSVPIFDRLGELDRVNLDEGGLIESEWREPVDPEWFEPWLARLLSSEAARELPTETCQQTRIQLRKLGFPTRGRPGRDFWYVRTAKAVIDDAKPIPPGRNPLVFLVSEDLHFHSPHEVRTASGPQRIKILTSGNGPVVKYMLRAHRVLILCVCNYLSEI